MTSNESNEKPPLSNWQTRVLRCTVFHDPQPEPVSAEQLASIWKDTTGEDVESVVQKPKEGVVLAEGSVTAGQLLLVGRRDGYDLRLQMSAQSPPQYARGTPTLGSLPEVCAQFKPLAHKFLGAGPIPPLARLAYGAEIHLPMSSKSQAYKQLSEYLPGVVRAPERLSDFVYRCNRRADSKIMTDGTSVNRLATWKAVVYREVLVSLTQSESPRSQGGTFAVNLDLDINTPAERTDPLPAEQLEGIFDELVDMGDGIAREGDVL